MALFFFFFFFHFKCTLKCRLQFILFWTSLKFCRLVMGEVKLVLIMEPRGSFCTNIPCLSMKSVEDELNHARFSMVVVELVSLC